PPQKIEDSAELIAGSYLYFRLSKVGRRSSAHSHGGRTVPRFQSEVCALRMHGRLRQIPPLSRVSVSPRRLRCTKRLRGFWAAASPTRSNRSPGTCRRRSLGRRQTSRRRYERLASFALDD